MISAHLYNELAKRPLFQRLDLLVTWPFLGQNNHPYHLDELGLNLKERAVIQLRVGLFESSVIKIWGRISVRLLF